MRLPSRTLTEADAAIVRALIRLGWLQSDIASALGCNIGRVSEVEARKRFPTVEPADLSDPATRGRLAELLAAWNVRVGRLMSDALKTGGLI